MSETDPGFVTLFDAHFDAHFDAPDAADAASKALGSVKILRRGFRRLDLAESVAELPEDCCSLGQTIDYYRNVTSLEGNLAETVLAALRDVTADAGRAERFKNEPGFHESLLRFSEAARIYRLGPAALLASTAEAKPFALNYRVLLSGFDAPHELSLSFSPEKLALGRLAAVAGPNGTGKTQLLLLGSGPAKSEIATHILRPFSHCSSGLVD